MLNRSSGLIEIVRQNLNFQRTEALELAYQWYTVDALLYSGASMYRIEGYPPKVHALIEHENRDDVETASLAGAAKGADVL
jgi:hypothetical protein